MQSTTEDQTAIPVTLADRPECLTVEEAARVLRIGRSAAYAGVKSGDIPSIKVGRSIRVPKHQLVHLLDQGPQDPDRRSIFKQDPTPH